MKQKKKDIHPGKKLKTQLQRGSVLLPGVYDSLSALLAKDAGFKALYLSGGALSVSVLGKPDIGLLTMDEVIFVAKRIIDVTELPLIVDVDTGFGGDINLKRCVEEFEHIGAAGIQVEDQVFPKRCGHLKGKNVIPSQDMIKKIQLIQKFRKSPDFLIVARTDARGVMGLEEARRRSHAYLRAGADIIFPEALTTKAEFKAVSRQIGPSHMMANMTEFGVSPALTVKELAHLGYRLALFPMSGFRMAAAAMKKTYTVLKKAGHSKSIVRQMQSRKELYKLIRYDSFDRLEKKLLK